LFGVQLQKNVLIILMSVEVMVLASNVLLVSSSCFFDDLYGQILFIFLLATAAAESCVALSIFVTFYRLRGEVQPLLVNLSKT